MAIDIFNNNIFKQISLIKGMEASPYVPGFIQSLGLFKKERSFTPDFGLEYNEGILSLITTKPRYNATGDIIDQPKRHTRKFAIPLLPQRTSINADDLIIRRPLGLSLEQAAAQDRWEMESIAAITAKRLQWMRQNIEATVEMHMMGALHGVMLEPDGSTVIYDYWSEFGITQQEFEVDLSVAPGGANSVRRVMPQVVRYLQNLGGGTYSNLLVLCGDRFYDDLINCPEFLKITERQNEGQFGRDLYVYDSYRAFKATWINYRGSVGSVNFIDPDEALIIPVGIPGLFRTIVGPVDTLTNPHSEFKVTTERQAHDTGLDLRATTSQLQLVTRPRYLTKLKRIDDPIS